MINEEELLSELTEAVKAYFSDCEAKAADTKIIGYSIYSSDTGDIFTPIASTEKGLENFIDGSREEFMYNPENWDLSGDSDLVSGVWESITKMYEICEDWDNDEYWHEEFRSRVYQLAVRTLENLKRQNFFEGDPFLIVWIVDSVEPLKRSKSWSKRLNSSERHLAYVEWLDSHAEHER